MFAINQSPVDCNHPEDEGEGTMRFSLTEANYQCTPDYLQLQRWLSLFGSGHCTTRPSAPSPGTPSSYQTRLPHSWSDCCFPGLGKSSCKCPARKMCKWGRERRGQRGTSDIRKPDEWFRPSSDRLYALNADGFSTVERFPGNGENALQLGFWNLLLSNFRGKAPSHSHSDISFADRLRCLSTMNFPSKRRGRGAAEPWTETRTRGRRRPEPPPCIFRSRSHEVPSAPPADIPREQPRSLPSPGPGGSTALRAGTAPSSPHIGCGARQSCGGGASRPRAQSQARTTQRVSGLPHPASKPPASTRGSFAFISPTLLSLFPYFCLFDSSQRQSFSKLQHLSSLTPASSHSSQMEDAAGFRSAVSCALGLPRGAEEYFPWKWNNRLSLS